MASALQRAGQRELALQEAEAAMRQDPKNARALSELGTLLILAGNPADGVPRLQAAVQKAPDDFPSWQRLAIGLNRAGDAERAIQAFRSGLRVNPFGFDLHSGLVEAAVAREDFGLAARHARYAARLRPEDRESWARLSAVAQQAGDYTNALTSAREVLRLQPDAVEALNNLAWLLASGPLALRNGAEAVGLAQRACELTGFNEAVLLGTLAASHAAAGEFAQAREFARKARELAEARGETEVAKRNADLLLLYQSNRAVPQPK
jgi:Flp pilus assembly protein TadD